jgi:adenosine deaminase CECR1
MASEEIEAWAQAEGVPSLTDPFIQKYLSGRDALVEQEKKQRSGRLTQRARWS